jgi:putative transposase
VTARDASLLAPIQALKAEQPLWGYRRIWAYLPVVEPLASKKKRVRRVRREHHLLVQPNRQRNATRTPSRSTPRPTPPQEWWGIDMTKVLVEGCGWVYLVLVLDWYTKKIVGD